MAHEQGLVFGEVAELYDRMRPSYPAELIDDVIVLAGLPCCAVDVGCGTGKATALLAAHGVEGVGVEPDSAMAAVARRNLHDYPGWRVDVSNFEEWLPRAEDRSFDLVTCAQAWHWIDHERGGQAAASLLRPGGWFVVFGNDSEREDTPLGRAIGAAYNDHRPQSETKPAGPHGPLVPPAASFATPIERTYRWSQLYTTVEWLELLQTHSPNVILGDEQRARLLAAVGAAIDGHGGTYEHRYLTRLWAAQRR